MREEDSGKEDHEVFIRRLDRRLKELKLGSYGFEYQDGSTVFDHESSPLMKRKSLAKQFGDAFIIESKRKKFELERKKVNS